MRRHIGTIVLILSLGLTSAACEDPPRSKPGEMQPIVPRSRIHDKAALSEVQLPTWPPLGSADLDPLELPEAYRRGMALLDADPDNLAMAEEAQLQAGILPADQALTQVLLARLQLVLGRKSDGRLLEGNLQAAYRHLDRALEIDPSCFEALFAKAELELQAGRRGNYDALVKRASAIRPDSPETALLKLRQSSQMIDFQKWMERADELIRRAQHPSLLRQTYALVTDAQLTRGNKARALSIQKAMLERLEGDPEAIRMHIDFLIRAKLPAEALHWSERLLELEPGADSLKLKADSACAMGLQIFGRTSDPALATPWLREAIRIDPEHAAAWLGLAKALQHKATTSGSESDRDQAFQAASRAMQLDPGKRETRLLYEGMRQR